MPQQSRQEYPAAALLELLAAPELARSLSLSEWDDIVRMARTAGVLAALRVRLARLGVLTEVPDSVRLHLDSDFTLARYRRQMVVWELECLTRALTELSGPLVLLKGAAYVVQGFSLAEGRMPSDVDLMVPRSQLDTAERALLEAGWQMEELDPYDERYYREWSHELPPMRYPEHPLELDLHHTILPLTGRAKPDAAALFEAATPVEGTRFHVLCPVDQVLHACAQLFQDSDCAGRLRDLADIDSLLGEFRRIDQFWEQLLERSHLHGLGRSLFYSLRYAKRYLGTEVPAEVLGATSAPPVPVLRLMDALVHRALLPTHPDRPPPVAVRAARGMLFLRSHWLRMPPLLLARHAATKAWRALRAAREESQPAEREA